MTKSPTHKDHLEVLRAFRANWGISKFCPPDTVGRINESFDYAISLLEKEGCEHELETDIYVSNPPQKRCGKCFNFFDIPHPLPPIEKLDELPVSHDEKMDRTQPSIEDINRHTIKINEVITHLTLIENRV